VSLARPTTAVPAVEAADALDARGRTVIDLRSEAEFVDDHLPGAIHVPLFDDAARALIGTLYHRSSPALAFEAGREAARARVESLVAEIGRASDWTPPATDLGALIDELTLGGIVETEARLVAAPTAAPDERAVILCCWRGGLRSKSVAALVRRLGLERAVILSGGYKRYRRLVIDRIDAWSPPRTIVLRGLTGVGKSLVLRELERLRPRSTIDLEALAEHRSSILGMVGLEPVTQKRFESRIAARLGEAQARVAAMLLLTLRGTPTLYYGDELGIGHVDIPPERVQDPRELREPGLGLGRDPVRTPMPWDATANAGFSSAAPWLPQNPDWPERNVASQSRQPDSSLALHRRLLAVRRAHPALELGELALIEASGDVLAYERQAGEQRLLVALNLSSTRQELTLPTWAQHAEPLLSTIAFGEPTRADERLTLRPDEGLILSPVSLS